MNKFECDDYAALLLNSYERTKEYSECPPESRLQYLADYIFDFTTYEDEAAILFATKAVEVCRAVLTGATYEYIGTHENRMWYLLMCNMPFFAERIDWGGSIRGAWWGYDIVYSSMGLWDGDVQMYDEYSFEDDEWRSFIQAIIDFAAPEMGVQA